MELRSTNKQLLECLRKSQKEIAQLLVTVKHSDHRVLSAPLTSTLAYHNKSSIRRSKAVTFKQQDSELKKYRSESKSTISNRHRPKTSALSETNNARSNKLHDINKCQQKSPVTSRFLQNKDATSQVSQCTPTKQSLMLTSPGNARPSRPKSTDSPGVVSLTTMDENSLVQTVFKTPDNLEELKEFRKLNRFECHSTKHWSELMKTPKTPLQKLPGGDLCKIQPRTPDPSNTRDPRIINFTVNKRIFPIPVDPKEDVLPGSETSPRYIRVSIPKSSLANPHKYAVTKRHAANDGLDSLSLPDNCAMGWQHTVPKRIEKHTKDYGLDIRSSLRPKENLVQLQLKSGQAIPIRNEIKDRSFFGNTLVFESN